MSESVAVAQNPQYSLRRFTKGQQLIDERSEKEDFTKFLSFNHRIIHVTYIRS